MNGYSKVILVGNLTRDPELRYLPKGTSTVRITLAVSRKWRTETGEDREEVSFVDVDAFGRQAEVISQYLKKGRPLMVEGRLRQDSWEDKTTHQKRTALKVVLDSFVFLDSGNRPEGAGAPGAPGEASAPAPAPRPPARPAPQPVPQAAPPPPADEPPPPMEEDDVPF